MIAVEQAEAFPAGGDVLETDAAVIPGIQLMLKLPALRGCCSGTRAATSSTRRSTSSSSSWCARTITRRRFLLGGGRGGVGRRSGGASRGRAVKELAALPVAAAARFLEESAHRQPPARLVRKGARVPELALALYRGGGGEKSKRKQPRSKYRSVVPVDQRRSMIRSADQLVQIQSSTGVLV